MDFEITSMILMLMIIIYSFSYLSSKNYEKQMVNSIETDIWKLNYLAGAIKL